MLAMPGPTRRDAKKVVFGIINANVPAAKGEGWTDGRIVSTFRKVGPEVSNSLNHPLHFITMFHLPSFFSPLTRHLHL
jgi:hypothetical protein